MMKIFVFLDTIFCILVSRQNFISYQPHSVPETAANCNKYSARKDIMQVSNGICELHAKCLHSFTNLTFALGLFCFFENSLKSCTPVRLRLKTKKKKKFYVSSQFNSITDILTCYIPAKSKLSYIYFENLVSYIYSLYVKDELINFSDIHIHSFLKNFMQAFRTLYLYIYTLKLRKIYFFNKKFVLRQNQISLKIVDNSA